jgi:sulfide:quinone oxidoreductase
MKKTVVVLGGGIGGLVAVNELRKTLPREHRVVLVDRAPAHLFLPSLLWVMAGQRKLSAISRPLSRLQRKGIEVVTAEVERIEPDTRELVAGGQRIAADFLLLALGADLAPETVPGLAEAGFNLYSPEGVLSIREAVARFEGGRLVVLTAAPAYKCPAAPYEAALLLEAECRRRGLRERTDIALYAAEPGPMGVAGPEVSKAVRQMVESRGIAYHPQHQVAAVGVPERRLSFANGSSADFDLLAYVPPHRAPRVVREAGLLGDSGWVAVDRHSMETRFAGVYAIGDVVSIPLSLGKPLPKAGVFAEGQARVAAQNIVAAIRGNGEASRFNGHGECFIEAGDGRAGVGRGNFYAEPVPTVQVFPPARRWHLSKVLFEKYWLWRWF